MIEKAEHQQSFASYQHNYRHRNSHKGTDPHHNKKSSSKQKKKHAQVNDGHSKSTNDQIQPLHKNYENEMPLAHNASAQSRQSQKQRSSKGKRSEHRKNAEGKKDKSRQRQERHADNVIRNEFLKEYPTNII